MRRWALGNEEGSDEKEGEEWMEKREGYDRYELKFRGVYIRLFSVTYMRA